MVTVQTFSTVRWEREREGKLEVAGSNDSHGGGGGVDKGGGGQVG